MVGGVVSTTVVLLRTGFTSLSCASPPAHDLSLVSGPTARCSVKRSKCVCTTEPADPPARIVTSNVGGVNGVVAVLPPTIGPATVSTAFPLVTATDDEPCALLLPVPGTMVADCAVPLVGTANE